MVTFLAAAMIGHNAITAWDSYLLFRQRRALDAKDAWANVPAKYKEQGMISEESFKKTQVYSRDKINFSLCSKLVKRLVINNFDFAFGTLPKLWNFTSGVFGFAQGSFGHCVLFGAAGTLIDTLVGLPFDYYYHFVLEEKHGFNKMTVTEWIKDKIKVFFLNSLVLNPILTATINWVVAKFGVNFPLYLFGASATIMTLATFIVPVLIMPLFNKYTPLAEGSLKSEIDNLAADLKFPLSKVYEMDGSRRSSHSNAFFYGFFNNKRIVLFDTLLNSLNEDEIMAVLCHEFGHWYHSHTLQMLGASLGQLFAFCYSARAVLFNDQLYSDFGFSDRNPYIGFSLYSMVYLEPISEVLSIAMSVVSRRYEFQADKFAVDQGRGEALRDGMIKMQKENSINVTPDWLFAACTYSHPPIIERLQTIDELIAGRSKKNE